MDEWWSLVNNTAFKTLFDTLSENDLVEFKTKYYDYLKTTTPSETLELNADTLFGIVTI